MDKNVSIIIPTYNRAHLIERAIDSALNQTIPGDEIIVVDDDSTDNTEAVIAKYNEAVRYFKIPNAGAGAARNFAIRESNNPFVAFLDSDDEWMPHKLDLQRNLLQARPDILLCFTDFAVTFKNGGKARKYISNWHRDPRTWDEILNPGEHYSSICELPEGIEDFKVHVGDLYTPMLKNPFIFTGTLMVRRQEAGPALAFAEDLRWGEDWVCYARLARAGNSAYLDCETAWQYGHEGERLTDTGMLEAVTTRIDIMNRVWGSDEDFLKNHGKEYNRLLEAQRLFRAKELIAIGNTKEARLELGNIASPPVWMRLMAVMPGFVIKCLLAARRLLRGG